MIPDLAVATQDALDDLHGLLPRFASWARACHDAMYTQMHRPPRHRDDEPPERVRRCGACEHGEDVHDDRGRCEAEDCRCVRLEPYPSTVGWAQWTGPNRAEVAYTAATKHLQRANDAIGQVERVRAHWSSAALDRPGNRTVPMRIELVLQGVQLLQAACRDVDPDDCAPPEASAVLEARDEVEAGIKGMQRAQDPMDDLERQELARRRCNVWVSASRQCQVEHHARGYCLAHYRDAMRDSA